jgi:hypothetical protein
VPFDGLKRQQFVKQIPGRIHFHVFPYQVWVPDAEVSHWTNLHWDGFQITALKCQYSSIRHLRIQPDSFDKLVSLKKHQNSPKRLNVASVVGGHLVNQTKQIGLHVSWSEVKQPNVEIEDPDLSGSVSRYRLFASWTVGAISGNPTVKGDSSLTPTGCKTPVDATPFLII